MQAVECKYILLPTAFIQQIAVLPLKKLIAVRLLSVPLGEK